MKIKKNEYGFFQIDPLPTNEFLFDYYKKKYYQDLTSTTYKKKYTKEELIINKIEAHISNTFFNQSCKVNDEKTLFDIGCGEGFFMKEMEKLGWKVQGCDFSNEGIRNQNPYLISKVEFGDIYEILKNCKNSFSFVNLDNVLEHVLYPKKLLESLKKIVKSKGIIRIEVPNDCTDFQDHLYNAKLSNKEYLVYPDHISYFNFDSLKSFLTDLDFEIVKIHGDFPISFYLQNKYSNYNIKPELGKEAHLSRVKIINYIYKKRGLTSLIKFFEGSYYSNLSRSCVFYVKNKSD